MMSMDNNMKNLGNGLNTKSMVHMGLNILNHRRRIHQKENPRFVPVSRNPTGQAIPSGA
jgi:hypothetical protein